MTDRIAVERPKYLIDLLAEIDSTDENAFPSPNAVEGTDKVLCEASVWTRKLFALSRYYHRECKRLKVEMEFDGNPEDSTQRRYLEMNTKIGLLLEVMWAVARSECPDGRGWHVESIGMRAGWKIVEPKSDPKAKFKEFLGGIIGGPFSSE